jgi:hypothetical protein
VEVFDITLVFREKLILSTFLDLFLDLLNELIAFASIMLLLQIESSRIGDIHGITLVKPQQLCIYLLRLSDISLGAMRSLPKILGVLVRVYILILNSRPS